MDPHTFDFNFTGSDAIGSEDFDLENLLREFTRYMQDALQDFGYADKSEAQTFLRALAARKPTRTIKAMLRHATKTHVLGLAKMFGLEIPERATKAKLEAMVYGKYVESGIAKFVFSSFTGDMTVLLSDIINDGDFVVPEGYDKIDLVPGLVAFLMISAWVNENDDLVLCIPKEAKAQLGDLFSEMSEVIEDKFLEIIYAYDDAASAAVELYGAIHFDDFLALCGNYGLPPMPSDMLRRDMDVLAEHEDCGYAFNGDYLIHFWLLGEGFEDTLEYIMARVDLLPRNILPKDVFFKFSDQAYSDRPLPWKRLEKLLTPEFPKALPYSNTNVNDIIVELMCCMKSLYSVEDCLEIIMKSGSDFSDTKRADKLADLLMDVHDNTRIWGNNGYTPLELAKRIDISKTSDVPDGEADSAKVGRNAPCPCGSGKKYKRCCGK